AGIRLIADGTPNAPEKCGCIRNVLQRLLAADKIGRIAAVGFGIEVGDHAHAPAGGTDSLPVPVGGVESYAAIAAALAEDLQKLSLAAADLQNRLAVEAVTADQIVRQLPVKGVERVGKALAGLIAGAISLEQRIEARVGDECAMAGESERDVTGGKALRLRPVARQHHAVYRHIVAAIELPQRGAAAVRTIRDGLGQDEPPRLA